ncbi:DASS family sodium-coupled anion symporter [Desulfofundulus sp. TPOSR]|uniref:SLC13 family permease n=1 Tax=Desulfofundulus sp. TPOSR TaxID=2714340 RepID=UPI00140BDE63|nr:DASS family sodium-coupled anion symporter [Desulfofundulus sp. TPOSR]NHM28755.1 DASS family sodium-coupled anion symporter [Desulfofundulus sp. TPOSR]
MVYLTLKLPGPLIRLFDRRYVGIYVSSLAFLILINVQFPDTISPLGAKLIAVLASMLIIWVTESVDYSTSAFYLIGILTLALADCPDPAGNGKTIGTREALAMSLSGFGSEAWILVTAALILASAVRESGLGERIAYWILLAAGPKPKNILLGMLLMSYLTSIFIPAQAANAALMCTVGLSIMEIYRIDKSDNFAKAVMLIVAFGTGIAGLGIQTSGAPTIQTANYLAEAGYPIKWLSWAIYGMPFSIVAGLVLYILICSRFPTKKLPGEIALIRQKLAAMGPVSARELKLAAIMLATTALWASEHKLHDIDSSTVSVLAVMTLFLPFNNITTWDRLVKNINWGILFLFGAAISLGQWLLKSGAASWMAQNTISLLNLQKLSLLPIVAVSVVFFSLMSLVFSARAAAVAALVPVAIGFAESFARSHGVTVWGCTLIFYYAIQYSVLLPVNTPMSMIAYSTETFSARDMLLTGAPLIVVLMLITLLFAKTYWHWLGLV